MHFPECELVERIGEGGIADVFRATWRGREVALKILRDPDRPGLRKRFLREGRILRRLVHPGLVRCLHVLDGEQPALVLELLCGEDLDQRVRRGALTGDEGVLLASSMLRTLAYLHEHGIVHRDVKASNIFLCDDRRAVLMDLGLAADPADPLTTTLGDVLGTHAYMAPEQIAGAETDHRCDLYSLGITLYEALTGSRPYQARGLAAWLVAHRSGGAAPVIELAPSTPVRLATLVERLMARDPAARPASAAVALALLTGTVGVRRELLTPRMVGREGARGALAALLDDGGVLRIQGEMGSGLGAVARLAHRLAREEGVEYALLRCRARAGLPEVLAALSGDLGALVDRVAAEPEAIRTALRDLVAEQGRFLLLVEDFDLAGAHVVGFVDTLATISGLALLVLGSALPDRPAGRTHVLRPLSSPEVRALVGSMLGTPTVPTGLDAALHQVSGGLPALVVAILREQVERGAIWCVGAGEEGDARWTWDTSTPLSPGGDAIRPFARSLDLLPAGTRRVAETLAVAAQPVPLDLLLEAAGADPSGLDLGPALRSGLLDVTVERGEEWVTLRRAVLEPLISGQLLEEERRRLHLALADAVSLRPQGEWERRFLLLHMALGAHDPHETERLVLLGDWLVAGGRAVEGLMALDAAARLPLESPRATTLLALARGDALRAVGRLEEARAALEAGRVLAAEVGDIRLREHALLAIVEQDQAQGSDLPDVLLHDLLELATRPEPDPRALLLTAEARRRAGDLGTAAADLRRCLAIASPGPVDRVAVAARFELARLDLIRGGLPEAAARLRELAAETRSLDRVQAAGEALALLAELHLREGAFSAAIDDLRAAESLLHDRGLPWVGAMVALRHARLLLVCGDLEGAAEALRGQATCGEARSPWPVRVLYLDTIAELRSAQRDTPAELAIHLRAAEVAHGAGDSTQAAFHAGMAGVLTADPDAVSDAVDRLREIGVPRMVARLLLAGGVTGRDRELLEIAADFARLAGDRLLTLAVLHAERTPAARAEARGLVLAMLASLFGPLRVSFQDRPAVRWALGEPSGGRRDTRD